MTERDPITGLYPYQQELIDQLQDPQRRERVMIITHTHRHNKGRLAALVAQFLGKQLRETTEGLVGTRPKPDIIIIDDVIDETQTPEQRQAIWDALDGWPHNPNAQVLLDHSGIERRYLVPEKEQAPEGKPRPHWQELNGGDKPWKRRKQRK